jgi:putative transcriptional regulator
MDIVYIQQGNDIFCDRSMVYGEKEMPKSPEAVLKEAGFSVSERCYARPSCFDFVARKNATLILVKEQLDIDGFSQSEAKELNSISECMSAACLLIGEKSREKPLKDDTVYSRYDILSVTPKTFENTVVHKTFPLIHARPGGYFVEIDNETIRKRRQEMGFSIGEMAEMVGISRRTLYGYEHSMAKASVVAAYNMVYTLGMPVAKPLNVLEKARIKHKCFLTEKLSTVKNKLLQRMLKKFALYRLMAVRKAPFDFILNIHEEDVKIIGGVATEKEKELDKRVGEILSVSRVVKAHSVLITDNNHLPKKDIACISKDELSKIRNPEDLIARL